MSNDNSTRKASKQALTATKRAILYARVSTDEQAGEGHYSLQTQIEACQTYAEQQGFTIVGDQFFDLKVGRVVQTPNENTVPAYVDDYTGTKLDRPGLDPARAKVDHNETDAVIVYASDRLTRNLAHLLILREEFQRVGVELHFVNRGKSEDTPEHRMTENIEGVFNEYWREKIIEASRRGRDGKARNNQMILPSWPSYGYTRQGKQWVIVEAEVNVVKLVYHWYLIGDNGSGPLSLIKISGKLNEMGLPVPKSAKIRNRGVWQPMTVHRILTNEIYTGVAYFGKTRSVDGKPVKQPREKWIRIDVPDLAFIDPATFQAAQERIKKNKIYAGRNRRRQYLLTGHIWCGDCHKPMGGWTSVSSKGYESSGYVCSNYKYWLGPNCPSKKRKLNIIADARVWEWIVSRFSDPDTLKRELTAIAERKETELAPKRKQLEVIQDLLDKAEHKIKRLASVIGDTDDDDAIDALKAQLKATSEDKKHLAKELDIIAVELAQAESLTPDKIESFALRAGQFFEKLIAPTFEEKRQWLDRLNVRITFRRDDQIGRRLDIQCELGEAAIFLDQDGSAIDSRKQLYSHTSAVFGSWGCPFGQDSVRRC